MIYTLDGGLPGDPTTEEIAFYIEKVLEFDLPFVLSNLNEIRELETNIHI